MNADRSAWPRLDYAAWRDTGATLHRWTQIVGKVRLALTPWLNHGWQVPLYVTARGLGTSAIHFGNGEAFEIDFDFVDHRLVVRSSHAAERGFALAPMAVAEFYRRVFAELAAIGVDVAIHGAPNEIDDARPFAEDTVHASYDAAAVGAFFRALAQADRVLRRFRTGFLGKASPVHFFWGSFDLAATRFPKPRSIRTRIRSRRDIRAQRSSRAEHAGPPRSANGCFLTPKCSAHAIRKRPCSRSWRRRTAPRRLSAAGTRHSSARSASRAFRATCPAVERAAARASTVHARSALLVHSLVHRRCGQQRLTRLNRGANRA